MAIPDAPHFLSDLRSVGSLVVKQGNRVTWRELSGRNREGRSQSGRLRVSRIWEDLRASSERSSPKPCMDVLHMRGNGGAMNRHYALESVSGNVKHFISRHQQNSRLLVRLMVCELSRQGEGDFDGLYSDGRYSSQPQAGSHNE